MALPDARRVQLVAAILLASATLLMVIAQFVPWHTFEIDNGNARGTTDLWGYHERFGDNAHSSGTWFEDHEERDGIARLQAGAILFTLATFAAGVATAGILLDAKWRGIPPTVAAVLAIISTVFVTDGTQAFSNIHVDTGGGTLIAILACFTLTVGSLLAFLPSPGLQLREKVESWASSE